jgi:hypothetical protein
MKSATAYKKADTEWLASCTFGIGVHWTTQTAARAGSPLPYAEAVDRFRLGEFLAAVSASGADYVIFTLTHALQFLPCPHPVVDGILPGRTMKRDLLGELARGLEAIGKKLIVYYNHSCNQGEDPAWESAVGYHGQPKDRLADNVCAIVSWLGERYGNLIRAWWFDSCYSLDPRGPHNAVSTDLGNFQFPWEKLTKAAKAGHAQRLVTYNSGVALDFLYTDHQDFWAGELSNLEAPPTKRFLDNGLQWHGWACLDEPGWIYSNNRTLPHAPLYSDQEVVTFLSACRRHQAPMTFNVAIYQDGVLAERSVRQLARVVKAMPG